ncbi:MAG: DJ-1/PfpI family protein, partial [Bdellovibrionota bacterium]
MKIGIVVFNKFTDLDFYLPWDLLNRVRLLGLHENWQVEILCDDLKIKSATGLDLQPTKPYSFANECDAVFFCSGYETRELIQDKNFLANFALDETKQIIAAVDSGALLLAALGLLQNKKATTYPMALDLLTSLGVNVVREPFVAEGNIATGARCLSGDRLALWMIEQLVG